MLRFYHSLWTAPLTKEKVRVTMLSFASSFLFAKQLGAQVVLHTDALGREMLKDIPYDEVYQDLNGLNPQIKFWAAGKLFATAREPLGAIHIDGDVFLKEKTLANLFTNDYDMLVQNAEGEQWRIDDTYKLTQKAIGDGLLQDGLHIDYPQAYNCGITQFINDDLKNKYLQMYFDTVGRISQDSGFIARQNAILADPNRKGYVVPDIVVEQQCLHELATLMGAKVKEVLTGDINKCADEIGYCHLLSVKKYKMQAELADLLRSLDNRIYLNVTKNPVWLANK